MVAGLLFNVLAFFEVVAHGVGCGVGLSMRFVVPLGCAIMLAAPLRTIFIECSLANLVTNSILFSSIFEMSLPKIRENSFGWGVRTVLELNFDISFGYSARPFTPSASITKGQLMAGKSSFKS